MSDAEWWSATRGSRPGRIGIVDLGSTTATLALFDLSTAGWPARVSQEVRPLHLVRALDRQGAVPSRAVEDLAACVASFARRARRAGATHLRAFATSALRESANGPEVARLLERRTGVGVRILSGEEEARAAAAGALHLLPGHDGLILDLGGGSLQVVRVQGLRVREAVSLPLGSSRMSARFLGADPPSGAEVVALREHALEALSAERWIARGGPEVVAIGGTLRTLGKLERRELGSPVSHVHGLVLTADRLLAWIDVLSRLPRSRRARWRGLPSHRVDSVVAGAIVAWALLRASRAERAVISGFGLREGLALEVSGFPSAPHDSVLSSILGGDAAAGADARRRALVGLDGTSLRPGRAERGGLALAAWVLGAGVPEPSLLLRRPVPGHRQDEVLIAARLLGLVDGGAPPALASALAGADRSA